MKIYIFENLNLINNNVIKLLHFGQTLYQF